MLLLRMHKNIVDTETKAYSFYQSTAYKRNTAKSIQAYSSI